MIDSIFLMFGLAVFIAIALGLESVFVWWNSTRGPEARRMENRLREASAGIHSQSQLSILKQRMLSESEGIERLLLLLPRIHHLDRALIQSGLSLSVGEFVGISLTLFFGTFIGMLLFFKGMLLPFVMGIGLGAVPSLHLVYSRAKRLEKIENQLPEAIDLMGRALRAGHAFPTALQMVGEEMSAPIGIEFRVLFDEINYGVPVNDAMLNLLSRVPSTDLRYFVVAVMIQRDTGGNLAELLDSISAIVRARLKLMGDVRTLSAEGRLSAWILSLLPFCFGTVIQVVNPGFLSELWTSPLGMKLVYGALILMVVGIFWMRRVIKIHV